MRLWDKPYEESFRTIEEKTEDISYPIRVVYKGYEIYHYKTVSYLVLSLHKYWNSLNGSFYYNYDDFPIVNVRRAILALCEDLSINPNQLEIVNLEFGVNIRIESCPKEFIKSKIHSHRRKFHGIPKDYNGAGYSVDFNHAQYIIKLYDKGAQHGLDYPLLRYEIRIIKSKGTKSIGIVNLSDLLVKDNLTRLGQLLLERFEEILILDFYHAKAPTSYWENRAKAVSSATLWREWKRFLKEIESRNLLQTKIRYKELIQNKWKELNDGELFLP